ncbi:hypothetical protein BDR22DRAFT_820193 [Usnea florida]
MAHALTTHNSSGIPPSTLHTLQPRQIFLMPLLGWHQIMEPALILIIPALSVGALLILREIFTKILDKALNVWANTPLSNQVVIEAGMMRLEFGCAMQPVPVEFIAEFALSQRDAVERGFAPVFAREWWWDGEDSGRVCYVGIRYVGDGGTVAPPRIA